MTTEQIEISIALGDVTYLPGSFNKRLGLALHYMAINNPEKELSESQNEWMYRLLYKYRRQIPSVYEKYKANEFCNDKNK